MNYADYWKERIRALEKARHESNGRLAKRLETELDIALREMDDKISGWYSRIAKNNAVSMAEARRMLSSGELKEFYWTVEEYIKKGRENGIRHNWEKELENASARVHISKLEALKIELRGIAERLGTSEEAQIRRHLAAQYEETYYRTAFELQNGMGVYQSMASVSRKQLETVLSKPWTADKKTFSDRIWADKDALIDEVTRQLTRNVLLGKPREDAIKAIAKRFDTSKSNAARLVHTESAFVSAEAAKDTYVSLGVERFEVDAALDAKTCSVCGEMDEKNFDRKDYQPGLTANPFHPNCRCTTVPYIDDDIQRELEKKTGRAIRNPETGKTEITDAMTYKEWKEKYVDNSAENGIIETGRGKAMSISNIDRPIEQRNTAKGNPNAILQIGRPLNNRQQRLLDSLNEYDSRTVVNKKTVSMKDLSALTAFTGDEFAMFTKGGERLIIRGNTHSVNIDVKKALELSKQGYRWSGHTHPGVEWNSSMPSGGDKEILKCFKQETSVIYDSKGKYRTFDKE